MKKIKVLFLEDIGEIAGGPNSLLQLFSKINKDVEIHKLNDELEKFKKMIDTNNNLYESMLDKTTQSLEKIISNTESLSKIQ